MSNDPHLPEKLVHDGAAVLTAAAYECDGPDKGCPLPEQECFLAHPVTFSALVGGVTHVSGSSLDIARIVLQAAAELPPTITPAESLRHKLMDALHNLQSGDRELAASILKSIPPDDVRGAIELARGLADLIKDTGLEQFADRKLDPAPPKTGFCHHCSRTVPADHTCTPDGSPLCETCGKPQPGRPHFHIGKGI